MSEFKLVAPNIKNGGGKELLGYLVEYIGSSKCVKKYQVYIDKSVQKDIKGFEKMTVLTYSGVMSKVALFAKKFNNTLFFGNLPPLRKSPNSYVYLHNPYLVMGWSELLKTGRKTFLKYSVQKLYIKFFLNNVDFFICQNELMKNKFIQNYQTKRIRILPFYRSCNFDQNKKDKKFDFCYVSLAHHHKNHKLLLQAFELLSDRGESCSVALTVEGGNSLLLKMIDEINEKGVVEIMNFGVVPKDVVCTIYSQSETLVFPSLSETFGLPLVEAAEGRMKVIAPNLPYVRQVIVPSAVFDPADPNDLADKLIVDLSDKSEYPYARPLIKNNIDQLINLVVLQKN